MTEDEVYDLLEEAEASVGRHAGALAEFVGARLPNGAIVARTFCERSIFLYTGTSVALPPCAVPRSVGEAAAGSPAVPEGCEPCRVCGLPLRIGEQGCIYRVVPHEPVLAYHPFSPYFDVGLGVEVTSLAQRWALMKGETTCDGDQIRPKLDYRDKMRPGDLSARRDRIEQQRKEQAR